MKTNITITVAALLIGFGLAESGHCQNYQTVTTIPGFGIKLADQAGQASDSFDVNVSGSFNVSNNITVNAGAQTIEDQGSFFLPSASGFSVFHETRQITMPAVFPNPPQTVSVSGELTVNVFFVGGGFQFDTGPRSLSYVGASLLGPNTWKFFGGTFVNMPVEVSYSLDTGGQTYTGTVDQNLQFFYSSGSFLETSDYPATLNISPTPFEETVSDIANVTASNGFNVDVIAVVPEPSTYLLGGLAACAVVLFRRHRT